MPVFQTDVHSHKLQNQISMCRMFNFWAQDNTNQFLTFVAWVITVTSDRSSFIINVIFAAHQICQADHHFLMIFLAKIMRHITAI